MKQGVWVTRAVIAILFAAVAVYLVVAVWRGLSDPYQLVVTYAYEMDDGVTLAGCVVRAEQAVQGGSPRSEVLPQEGERVAAGAPVARIYQSESALNDHRQVRALELELEQLQYAMGRGDTVPDAAKMDAELVEDWAAIRCGVSAGELDRLEERGLDVRSLVVKRTGTAATNAESLAQLQSAAGEVESRLNALRASAAQGTRLVTVERGGVFSGLADGFEDLLTPDVLETLTARELDRLEREGATAPANSVGKLITDSAWYYAAPVSEEDARRLTEGNAYTLDFSGDFDQEVSMRLVRLGGAEEDGRRLAVFSSHQFLSRVTLARFTGARLVFRRYTGVRVPDRALRVRDNADGSTTLGVFVLVGRQAEFKRVEVIREGEEFYLVQGTDPNRKVLRPGDTVVLSSRELYDGKVVL